MGDSEKYAKKPVQKPLITPEILPQVIKEGATKKGDISPPVSLLAMKNKVVDTKGADFKNKKSERTEVEVKQINQLIAKEKYPERQVIASEVESIRQKMAIEDKTNGISNEESRKRQAEIKVGMTWTEAAEKLRNMGYTETLKWVEQKLNEQKKSQPKGGSQTKKEGEKAKDGEERKRRKGEYEKTKGIAEKHRPKTGMEESLETGGKPSENKAEQAQKPPEQKKDAPATEFFTKPKQD
ncbi:MAG: hypothetical protein Q8K98_06325 [Bacteroidota bacterium]|nr:hypothetical protein [Bacteroidota bacterium]